jgi:hypothetical protein
MAKVDLSDAYMRIWLQISDLPKLAFVVPPHPSDPKPLIGFHLSLPMRYIESTPFFCTTTETAADLIYHSWKFSSLALAHPLECFTSPPPPLIATPEPTRAALAYINDFLALCQGPPDTLQQAQYHIFHTIDLLFRPNNLKD